MYGAICYYVIYRTRVRCTLFLFLACIKKCNVNEVIGFLEHCIESFKSKWIHLPLFSSVRRDSFAVFWNKVGKRQFPMGILRICEIFWFFRWELEFGWFDGRRLDIINPKNNAISRIETREVWIFDKLINPMLRIWQSSATSKPILKGRRRLTDWDSIYSNS